MDTDTITFEYTQPIGLGWTMPPLPVRVRVTSNRCAEWEVEILATKTLGGGLYDEQYRNIDVRPETAVQELRAAIVWHVKETMQAEIEGCVKAYRSGTAYRQKADQHLAAE